MVVLTTRQASNTAMYTSIAWSNCWQVAVSILYVQYNAILTAFLVGDEWSRFACATQSDEANQDHDAVRSDVKESSSAKTITKRHPKMGAWGRTKALLERTVIRKHHESKATSRVKKPLRVSVPEGIQRSTYFVSMPLRYGIPLQSSTALLHWLISQSIFVLAADTYRSDGSLVPELSLYATGFSIQAIITCKYKPDISAFFSVHLANCPYLALALGLVYIVVLVRLGLRWYPADIPLASSCSAAISAACHRPEGDWEAHMFPVQWGVVSEKDGVGHCSLTTARDVTAPVKGKLYA